MEEQAQKSNSERASYWQTVPVEASLIPLSVRNLVKDEFCSSTHFGKIASVTDINPENRDDNVIEISVDMDCEHILENICMIL